MITVGVGFESGDGGGGGVAGCSSRTSLVAHVFFIQMATIQYGASNYKCSCGSSDIRLQHNC